MKIRTSVTFSKECKRLLDALALKLGLPVSGVLELASRRLAEVEGVK